MTIYSKKHTKMNKNETNNTAPSPNTQHLVAEMEWLEKLVSLALQQPDGRAIGECPPPVVLPSPSTYAHLVGTHAPSPEDRLLLALALATSVRPQLLEKAFNNVGYQQRHLAYGGIIGQHFRGFVPTGQTYLYLLAGEDPALRLQAIQQLKHSPLVLSSAIGFGDQYPGEPFLSGPIIVNDAVLYAVMMDEPMPEPDEQPYAEGMDVSQEEYPY